MGDLPASIAPAVKSGLEPPMRGTELRALRERLEHSQSQFARILQISKGYLSNIEWRDKAVPAHIVERARTVAAYRELAASTLAQAPRKGTWRTSINFKRPAPFEGRPPCGCNHSRCTLEPVEDRELKDGSGHVWLYQGSRCRRRVYLDATGARVPWLRFAGDLVPREICSQCGRQRSLEHRRGKEFYYRYCRRRPNDSPGLEHDPRTAYRIREGKAERVYEELVRLRSRAKYRCDRPGCPGYGQPLRPSGKRAHGAIAGYVCRAATEHHYTYLALPDGHAAERLPSGKYHYVDATGESHELGAERTAARTTPEVRCRTHGTILKRRSGPWRSKRTRKRTWGLECPTDGERFYFDGELRSGKGSRWRAKGRPARTGEAMERRILVAAAAAACGLNKYEAAPLVYPDSPKGAYANTKTLYGRHKARIEAEVARLEPPKAAEVLRSAGWTSTRGSEKSD